MKKRVLAIFVTICLLLSVFVGCGGNSGTSTPNASQSSSSSSEKASVAQAGSSAAPSEAVTVKVRSGWNEESLPNWPAAIETFERDHPDINVDMEFTPTGENSMLKLRAEFVAGNPPDVVQAWKTFFNEFVDAGLVENLNADYEKAGWTEGVLMGGARNWCAPLADAANPNADVYGVADFLLTSVMFYNTDVFDELGLTEPTTLDELITVGKALAAAGKKPLVVAASKDSFVDLLAKIQVQFTGLQYLLDVNSGKAKLTDEPMLKAMQVVERLIKEGILDPSCITYTDDDASAALANGSAGMYSMHAALNNKLKNLQEADPSFHYAIMKGIKFTDNPVTEYSATYGGCWMIPQSSTVKDQAKEFLFYIMGEDVSKTSAATGRITNMLAANVANSSEVLKTVFDYQLPNLSDDSFYLIDMVPGSVLASLISGMQAMLQGTGDAQSALEDAQKAMDQVLADAS